MRRVFASIAAIGLVPAGMAADFSGYVTLTSDFVRRGVSQSDADPALQLGADVAFDNGLVTGAWGSSVDNRSQPGRQQDIELNTYLGYGFDAGENWRLSGYAVAYLYPGMDTPFDYDYVEYLVSANFDDRYWLEYAYSPDYYGTGHSAWNAEVLGEWPLLRLLAVSAGIGRLDLTDVVGSGYTYWQVGISGNLRNAQIDFRFHDTDRLVPFFSSAGTAGPRVAVTLTIPF